MFNDTGSLEREPEEGFKLYSLRTKVDGIKANPAGDAGAVFGKRGLKRRAESICKAGEKYTRGIPEKGVRELVWCKQGTGGSALETGEKENRY